MFPSMLGSRGHAYLMVFILSVLYRGELSHKSPGLTGLNGVSLGRLNEKYYFSAVVML